MKVFFARLDACPVRKNITYFMGMILWLAVTAMLAAKEDPESFLRLRSLLFVKMSLAGIVFLGRELLFSNYRRPQWLIYLWGLGWLPLLGIQVFRSGVGSIILVTLDTMIWGMLLALSLEVLLALFVTWSRTPRMPMVEIRGIWEQCWREIVRLGLWMTLTESLGYFYLIHFYLVDVLLYRNLFLILMTGMGLGLFASLAFRINHWITEEIVAIDRQLDPLTQWWREIPAGAEAQGVSRCHQLLLIREYLLGFRWPRISFKSVFYYLLLLVWLYGLPYIFDAML